MGILFFCGFVHREDTMHWCKIWAYKFGWNHNQDSHYILSSLFPFLLVKGVELSIMCLKGRKYIFNSHKFRIFVWKLFWNQKWEFSQEKDKKFLVSYKKFEHDTHSSRQWVTYICNSKQLFTRNTQIKYQTWTFYGLQKAPASPYILATYWDSENFRF